MLIYKQRYKPRTTREFTKSDLTVYDSAGNTALNALTVYGKSEVVDGSIKSAGEGYAVVDLGTLNWSYFPNYPTPMFGTDAITLGCKTSSDKFVCKLYQPELNAWYTPNNDMKIASGASNLNITNLNYTDATAFKNAMSGVLLCYQLADPSQGNTIAVKTDNGSGINGTMAVFETGTPLRGIPDTTVRDVMVWDGSAGTATKNCGKIDLGTLTWNYDTKYQRFVSSSLSTTIKAPADGDIIANIITPKYTTASINYLIYTTPLPDKIIAVGTSGAVSIRDTDYTSPTDFATALSGVKLVYELAIPTTEQLTTAENASIAGLRTFEPQTHAQNNAGAEMTVDYTIRVPTI